jgi:hypothetical protein
MPGSKNNLLKLQYWCTFALSFGCGFEKREPFLRVNTQSKI